jgi:ribosomal protein S1
VKAKMANELMPFLQFVEKHPVGSKVKAVVDSYAANGITALIGGISGYVPLRNMAKPQPRSARDVFAIGDSVTLTVVGYTPARRSVDLAVPGVIDAVAKPSGKPLVAKKAAPDKKAAVAKKSAPVKKAVAVKKDVAAKLPVKKAFVAKASAKKVGAVKKAAPAKAPAKKAVAKKAPAKKR